MSNLTSGYDWQAGDTVTAARLKQAIESATPTAVGIALFVPRGYIDGLILANNSGDADHDIDIGPGIARNGGNTATLTLGSALTKRIDATWSAGTGNGGLDTGSIPVSGTLHLWLISNGTLVDVLFSTSATAPTMPVGYTLNRRIGAVLTDASSNVRGFFQNGNNFSLKSPIMDVNVLQGTTASLQAISVPTGLKVIASLSVGAHRLGAGTIEILVTDPDEGITGIPALFTMPIAHMAVGYHQFHSLVYSQLHLFTNVMRQVRINAAMSAVEVRISCRGWIDTRDRDA